MNKAVFENGNVRSNCPDCGGAITTFEFKRADGGEYGTVERTESAGTRSGATIRALYTLMKCAGCGRAGLAKLKSTRNYLDSQLEWFFPASSGPSNLPSDVPEGIKEEFKEASTCMAFGAYRAASALYRSCIEKVLKGSGYTSGDMKSKIDLAAKDGVITESRRLRAHEEIRVLGNDVLHDEWRKVLEEEAISAQEYSLRIIEDFYDHRESVLKVLKEKGKLLSQ